MSRCSQTCRSKVIFARLASSVTYADLPDLTRAYISKRFEIRNLRNIEMKDVRRLDPNRRYDIVNCMDVVEHVYDVEYILADLIARLKALTTCFQLPSRRQPRSESRVKAMAVRPPKKLKPWPAQKA